MAKNGPGQPLGQTSQQAKLGGNTLSRVPAF
jgi:hypothetical protein